MQNIIDKLNEIQKYIEQQDNEIQQLKNIKYTIPIMEEPLPNHLGDNDVKSNIGCLKYKDTGIYGPYWNSNQSPDKFKISVKLIDGCINVASKYGGRVFGGYVRNVLIPHFYNQKSVGFKDVDLWFLKPSDALNFVLDMGDRLSYKNTTDQYNNQIGKV